MVVKGYYTVEVIHNYNQGDFGGHTVWHKEEDLEEALKYLRGRIETMEKDCANLDTCDKEEVIKEINSIFGSPLTKEKSQ